MERYDHDHAALAVLLGPNGLRVSEACATNIEDLGIERGIGVLRIVGKGNKPATIPLVPRTARTVDLAIGERCSESILRRCDGQHFDRRTAHRWVRSIGKRAGIDPVHPHMLRAAFIMAALDASVPLRDVQLAARHADPQPPPSTTGDDKTSTDTPPTSSLPTSPADRPDPCSSPSASDQPSEADCPSECIGQSGTDVCEDTPTTDLVSQNVISAYTNSQPVRMSHPVGSATGKAGWENPHVTLAPSESIGAVVAPDGTTIGYRVVGSGPSVVLLHGAGQSSGSFSKPARKLSGEFTVYVPDRRGRGMSGPYREDHGLSVEIDDLRAAPAWV